MKDNVVQLHKRLTPKEILQSSLDSCDDIKHVIVVSMQTDGTVLSGWSACKMSDLLFMARVLQIEIDRRIVQPDGDI